MLFSNLHKHDNLLLSKGLKVLFSAVLMFGCSTKNSDGDGEVKPIIPIEKCCANDSLVVEPIELLDTLSPKLLAAGLVDVQTIHPDIRVELKYASEDNFMQRNVYGGLKKAYLQPKVAERLGKVQEYLTENHPGYYLLVYDAVRPRSVQQFMWDLLDSIPINERTKFVSNPSRGSLHSFGCAVDVTLWKESEGVLDMGANYDDMRKIAYTQLEQHFLSTGELSKEQYANRLLLRKAMSQGGFWVIQTEWWHFNAHSRDTAKSLYEVIE